MALGTDVSGPAPTGVNLYGGGGGKAGRGYRGTAGRRGKGRPQPPMPVAEPPPGPSGAPKPLLPPVQPPGTTQGPQPIPTTGGPQTGTGTPSDILSFYSAPMPPIVNAYMQNMTKGGFSDLPTFNDLYNTYRATAEKETKRNAAALTETMGSQGARYGSDIMGAQSRLQENLGVDLGQQATQFLMGLRQQQFGEVSGMGQLQYGANEAGMTRMWEDFLRRTSPPPGLANLYNMAQSYGLPATVVGA